MADQRLAPNCHLGGARRLPRRGKSARRASRGTLCVTKKIHLKKANIALPKDYDKVIKQRIKITSYTNMLTDSLSGTASLPLQAI